jgi:hypothetical protein
VGSLIKKINKKVLIISLIFFVILYTVFTFFGGYIRANNFVFGWLISVLNYYGLHKKVKSGFEKGYLKVFLFNTQFRLILTGVAMYLWIKFYGIDIVGLLIGVSVIPLILPITAFIVIRRNENGAST